ncbi:hypothetical protein K470DRAFT_260587 [Piedraia hortae CBS 480.64]|uniref:Uncharacterized protein n=1 Tax=Piedraia hortae CBS 480.64 TaxID=1314780 RepID=A0A6A7BSG1_9PEZI|nr:hypothetical protein K470DRAFT_260587 [Piedraia hortae CBS 480.64]
MVSRVAIPVLVGMMLLTGVCNTLLTKYQVRIVADSHQTVPINYVYVGYAMCCRL